MLRRMMRRWGAQSLAMLVMLRCLQASAAAQGLSASLTATVVDVARLAPDTRTATSAVRVSDATRVVFDLVSVAPGVGLTIRTPDGSRLDEITVGAFGGQFERRSVAPNSGSLLVDPFGTPGEHVVVTVPSPAPGEWTLELSAPASISAELAVGITTTMESATGLALVALPNDIVLGRAISLTAAAFSGTLPIAGAVIDVQLVAPSGASSAITLKDDGVAPDGALNDGLYAGALIPTEIGRYAALATLTATLPGGTAVVRQATAEFGVVQPTLALLGAVTPRLVDSNGNGLIDALELDVLVNVLKAGDFVARAVLTSSTGTTVAATTRVSLATGSSRVSITFSADALRSLGVDGPYQMGPIEILYLAPSGAQPADRIIDAGQTPVIRLAALEQPRIRFTGIERDAGIDQNGNGLFDRLRVELDLAFLIPGSYSGSAILFDSRGVQIGFATGNVLASAGTATLQLLFDGRSIGTNGVNGPYTIGNLLVNGPGGALVLLTVAQTSAYRANQFEGSPQNREPIAVAGPDRVVRIGSLVRLDGSGSSDPDRGPALLQFAWTQTGGPTVTLSGAATASPSFTPVTVGTYTMKLTVSDGAASSADTVAISVSILGDVDSDGDVDTLDLNAVVAGRNAALVTANDVRDLNADGRVDAVDARILTTLCTRARCSVQ